MSENRYARAIRMTQSGVAYNGPTLVSSFGVNSVNADCIVNLRDGGAAGPIMWSLEGDNAASSPAINFEPPIKFDRNVYVEFVVGGSQSSAYIAVSVL